MIFVNYDFGDYEGEQGCGFFPDLETAKKQIIEEGCGVCFNVYYEDGKRENYSASGELISSSEK